MFYKWISIIPSFEGSPKIIFPRATILFRWMNLVFRTFFFTHLETSEKINIFMNQSFVIRARYQRHWTSSASEKNVGKVKNTKELNETIELVFLNFIERWQRKFNQESPVRNIVGEVR